MTMLHRSSETHGCWNCLKTFLSKEFCKNSFWSSGFDFSSSAHVTCYCLSGDVYRLGEHCSGSEGSTGTIKPRLSTEWSKLTSYPNPLSHHSLSFFPPCSPLLLILLPLLLACSICCLPFSPSSLPSFQLSIRFLFLASSLSASILAPFPGPSRGPLLAGGPLGAAAASCWCRRPA